MKKQMPWLRAVLEGALIVSSILLGQSRLADAERTFRATIDISNRLGTVIENGPIRNVITARLSKLHSVVSEQAHTRQECKRQPQNNQQKGDDISGTQEL